MTLITYHVAQRNDGFGYGLGDVRPDHAAALAAATSAVDRPHFEGRDAQISSLLAHDRWQAERASSGNPMQTDVIDGAKGETS